MTEGLLRAALDLHQNGRLAEAEAQYRVALARAPNHVDALQYLGVLMVQSGRGDAGVALIERAIAVDPDNLDAHFNLAQALAGLGRIDDATAALRRAVTAAPNFFPGWMQLGALLLDRRRFDEAGDCFATAARLAPGDSIAAYNLGFARQAADRQADAAAAYRAATRIDPAHADAHNNLGLVLGELGEHNDSVESFQRALQLKPQAVGLHVNLGTALYKAGRLDAAIDRFRTAIALAPGSAEAEYGLGLAIQARGDSMAAAALFGKVLERNPGHLGALLGLAPLLIAQERYRDAEALLRRALAVAPDSPEAHAYMAHVHFWTTGDIAATVDCTRRSLALRPDQPGVRSSLLMFSQYDPEPSAPQLRALHDEFESAHAAGFRADWRPYANLRAAGRRLRVGYVSPDFRRHSCAYFIEPLLAAHDRRVVEVVCYAQVKTPDAVTARLRALADRWNDIGQRSDAQLAADIRRDEIDILVDLAGHTADNRMLLFARKPAPVQVSWLGYPGTTGLRAIDYRLSDAVADPPGAETPSCEAPIRLASGMHCYLPPDDAPPVAPLPALREGRVTFGCFNNLSKVNDRVIAVWAALLAAVPGARLALKDSRLRDRSNGQATVARFVAHGIDAERIVLLPPLRTTAEFLGLYGGVDVALDSFPYNGVTTTCESLWMGAPVVTMIDDRFAARMGASLLTQIGREAWIAENATDYVQIAVELARDLDRLAAERAALRPRMAASRLCDAAGFARAVESGYRAMWDSWCGETSADSASQF